MEVLVFRIDGVSTARCHIVSVRCSSVSPVLRLFTVHPGSGKVADTRADPLILLLLFSSTEKPMPQGPPGGAIGILGGVVIIGLIAGVAATVFIVHRRQQKTGTETDNDL